MARIFTWTGRGGDIGQLGLAKYFTLRIQGTNPKMSNITGMGWCLDLINFGCDAKVVLPVAKSEIYLAFLAMNNTDASGSSLLEFTLGATNLATLNRANHTNVNGPQLPVVQICKGHNTTELARSIPCFAGDFQADFYQVYYKPAVTTGRFKVIVNGKTVVDFTGTTVPGSEATLDGIHFGPAQYTNNCYFYYNDIVVDDAVMPPISKMVALVPNGAGNYSQWSPSTGANWGCVDEQPPAMGDFVHANAADDSDSYAAGNMPAEAIAIKGVTVGAWAVKENSPTPTQVKALVRTGSTPTDYVGSGVTVGIYQTMLAAFWANNPYTAAAWTLDEVNGMEIGVKSAA